MSFATPHNIWAVGRNYAEHARELGHAVPEAAADPMIFLKAGTTAVENGAAFALPSFSQDIHHECELALRFGGGLRFDAMTLALDLTARDAQNRLKENKQPWTLAKSFRASCPMGPVTAIPSDLDLQQIQFTLKVNGDVRQKGDTRDMIHSIEKLRIYVVDRFPVVPGDWLLTGTPAGVGPLQPGDRIEASIEGFVSANWSVRV